MLPVAVGGIHQVSSSQAIGYLLTEHEEARLRRQIAAAYVRLRSDLQQWRSYVDKLEEWDVVASDAGKQQ